MELLCYLVPALAYCYQSSILMDFLALCYCSLSQGFLDHVHSLEMRMEFKENIYCEGVCFAPHNPWILIKPLIHHFGESIISMMESSTLATVGTIFLNGEWLFCPSNHIWAIELRDLCTSIVPLWMDKITWENIEGPCVFMSSIWQTIHRVSIAPPWIQLVWHKFSVPRYSLLLWLVLK